MFLYNTHVKSALISGIQWDMTMAFIASKARVDGRGNKYEVTKSDSSRHKGTWEEVEKAGNNEADKVCNIYDLEGNARECVAEKYTYTSYPFVDRGSDYINNHPASRRNFNDGTKYVGRTFRIVLYVE